MDQPGLVEDGEGIEELCGKDLDELCAEAAKLVLLDELVEIGGEELKDEAEVVFVYKLVAHAENVVLVVWVPGGVELEKG